MKQRWPVFLLAGLSLAFFLPYLIRGQGFLYGDNLTQRIPTLTFYKQELESGSIPLWNPFLLGGIPFLADLSNNTFAPTNLAYLLLPVPVGLTALVVCFVAVAAIGMFLFMHRLTGNRMAGLFSAVVFAFSGTTIASVNDINSLQGIALIPLVFYATQRWINQPSCGFIWPVLALALQFLSSHPQYSYYTWITLIAYIAFLKRGNRVKALAKGAMIVAVSLSLTAFQLLPFLELSRQSFRPNTVEFSRENELKIKEFPRLVFADFYGVIRSGSSWGPGSQLETGLANTEGYVGILPLGLSLFAVVRLKSRQTRFWAMVAVLAFLLSLGGQTPLLNPIRILLPLFSKFRSPIRILALHSFAVAVLVGHAIVELERKGNASLRKHA